ncbi:MAG: TetR/AcrR family transcriptional regulator, partial [Clostridia bacterium]|nr:TetR/AcrR family transcriptional regulator [Clostridia bacterium]
MVTRKQQAALSREKLLDAARELIIENGYNNISIVDITRACNMSVGNFYHYFKSKEELITVLEREGYDQDVVILQNMKGQPILEQLRFYMESYIDLMVNTYGHHFNRQWFIHYLNNPTPIDD